MVLKSDAVYWQAVDASLFQPDYIDVPGNSLRAYGASIVIVDTPERFALMPDQRSLPFIKFFGVLFLPLLAVVVYRFVPAPEKWILMVGGLVSGGIAFSIIYYLAHREVRGGAYFELFSHSRTVRLPRYDVEFRLEQIVTLQWITGASKHRSLERTTDLNLIVRTEEGAKQRYFLIGSPRKKIALALAKKIALPVTEVVLAGRDKRD